MLSERKSEELRSAVQDILLGAQIRTVHLEYQMRRLEIDDEDDWVDAIRRLDRSEREALRQDANNFVADVCRRLGERHNNDRRICTVLEDWVRDNKDYAVFDTLLSNFDFPSRGQVLDEGRRLFPNTMTAHWLRD